MKNNLSTIKTRIPKIIIPIECMNTILEAHEENHREEDSDVIQHSRIENKIRNNNCIFTQTPLSKGISHDDRKNSFHKIAKIIVLLLNKNTKH